MKFLFCILSLFCFTAQADLFKGHGLGLKVPKDWKDKASFLRFDFTLDLPSHFDWRDKLGMQIPVLNQGQCGSCWAFSRVETIMWQILIHQKEQVLISPQELVSCDRQELGCSGGYWDDYELTGISEEQAFPYSARDLRCPAKLPKDHKITEWKFIGDGKASPTVAEIKQAILLYGPVGATVAVRGKFPSGCSRGQTNHMVVLTGWDDKTGTWVMQNSWGTAWGDSGYAAIKYGCYNIGETVAVPTL